MSFELSSLGKEFKKNLEGGEKNQKYGIIYTPVYVFKKHHNSSHTKFSWSLVLQVLASSDLISCSLVLLVLASSDLISCSPVLLVLASSDLISCSLVLLLLASSDLISCSPVLLVLASSDLILVSSNYFFRPEVIRIFWSRFWGCISSYILVFRIYTEQLVLEVPIDWVSS